VLVALSALAVALALRRVVTAPVGRLSTRVRDVASGDYDQEIAVEGPAEFRGLAHDVEAMRQRIVEELAESTSARQQLDEQAEELRRSNAELEQFAYVASHDLQEPLRKVASFCQLLQRRYGDQLDERGQTYIEFAVDGAKRMQALINDLLTFSRVGRRGAGMQNVEIQRVVEQVTDSLATVLEENDATVEANDLPAVHADPVLMRQLFQNLLSNAIKFRAEAPPVVRLTAEHVDAAEAEHSGDGAGLPGDEGTEPRPMVRFTCADNGIGVAPEYADRIFVIFQRLHTKEAYPGTGIGLALCKKIVEYHGGRIWLAGTGSDGTESRPADSPSSGATFCFTLPAAIVESDGDTPGDAAPDETTTDDAADGAAPPPLGEVP
jgi:light-regulated signal transduction histidine kinase (bacteriophytochrome)